MKSKLLLQVNILKKYLLKRPLTLESLMVYAKQATGEKFLINPNG